MTPTRITTVAGLWGERDIFFFFFKKTFSCSTLLRGAQFDHNLPDFFQNSL